MIERSCFLSQQESGQRRDWYRNLYWLQLQLASLKLLNNRMCWHSGCPHFGVLSYELVGLPRMTLSNPVRVSRGLSDHSNKCEWMFGRDSKLGTAGNLIGNIIVKLSTPSIFGHWTMRTQRVSYLFRSERTACTPTSANRGRPLSSYTCCSLWKDSSHRSVKDNGTMKGKGAGPRDV